MPSRSRKSRKAATTKVDPVPARRHSPDLSFPVSHREQQRYLELADIFLALEEKSSPSNVIRINSRAPGSSRKAA